MNLIINAFDAMEDGGQLTLETNNVTVSEPMNGYETIGKGSYTQLSVIDTGIGIENDQLSRIFEPFFTDKNMERSGSGLGLAVVWAVIKDFYGLLDVSSELDKGSRFDLYFPPTNELVGHQPAIEQSRGAQPYRGQDSHRAEMVSDDSDVDRRQHDREQYRRCENPQQERAPTSTDA